MALTKLGNCARAVGLEVDELVRRARSAPGQLPNAMQVGGAAYIPPIGRDHDRDEVVADLIGSRGVVLFGAPGQGKTTLARYVAASLCEGFKHGVFEVDLESERQIENLPRLIANELGQADLSGSYDVLRGRSILLILDSVDQLLRDTPAPRFREAISAITRSMSKDSRLIITCQRNLEKQELVTREVRPLRDAAALELFHQMSDGLYRQDSAIAVTEFVCGVLAGHPLSIKIVARYGRRTRRRSCRLHCRQSSVRGSWRDPERNAGGRPAGTRIAGVSGSGSRRGYSDSLRKCRAWGLRPDRRQGSREVSGGRRRETTIRRCRMRAGRPADLVLLEQVWWRLATHGRSGGRSHV